MVMKVLEPWLAKFGLNVTPAPDAIPPLPTMLDCVLVGMTASEADVVLASWRADPQLWESLVRDAEKAKAARS